MKSDNIEIYTKWIEKLFPGNIEDVFIEYSKQKKFTF